jgi:hypothetical protein
MGTNPLRKTESIKATRVSRLHGMRSPNFRNGLSPVPNVLGRSLACPPVRSERAEGGIRLRQPRQQSPDLHRIPPPLSARGRDAGLVERRSHAQ